MTLSRINAPTRPKIVAVDGPAGSGKSSLCARVSERIGWTYINTGALYRGVGLLAINGGVSLDDVPGLVAMIENCGADLRWDADQRQLWYRETNLTPELNSEQAGYGASKVAKEEAVRACLLPVQRQLTLAAPVGALVDGRDIGTVVFPHAELKVFLTASLEERSRRRLHQLGGRDEGEALATIQQGIARRDERDSGRKTAPLKQADDAVVLDTSRLSIDESVEAVIELLRQRGLIPREA